HLRVVEAISHHPPRLGEHLLALLGLVEVEAQREADAPAPGVAQNGAARGGGRGRLRSAFARAAAAGRDRPDAAALHEEQRAAVLGPLQRRDALAEGRRTALGVGVGALRLGESPALVAVLLHRIQKEDGPAVGVARSDERVRAAVRRDGGGGDAVGEARELADAPVDAVPVDLDVDRALLLSAAGGPVAALGGGGLLLVVDVARERVALLARQRDAVERRDVLAQRGRAALDVAAQEDQLAAVGCPARLRRAEQHVVAEPLLLAARGGHDADVRAQVAVGAR